LATVNGKSIDLSPTEGMKAEAKRFRQWKAEGRRGGTDTAQRRASQILSSGEMSPDVVIVMSAWFARHEVDKQAEGFRPGEKGYPSPGRVAWAAWGGDAGKTWADAKSAAIKRARGETVKAYKRPDPRRALAQMPDGEPLFKIARDYLQAVGKFHVAQYAPEIYPKLKEIDPIDITRASIDMAGKFLPIITSYIDEAGQAALVELDQADADQWLVRAPHVIDAAKTATLDLCQETLDSFTIRLGNELDAVRRELADSLQSGETLGDTVNRVSRLIKEESRWRARRIAVTESARAYNQGQHDATKGLDFVAGYELILSADACPLCHAIHRQCPVIRKGGTFGTNGKNETYKDLKFPPFHPGCRCTTVVVFDDEVPDKWPSPVKPGDGGYILPSDADFAAAEEGGYESVAIGNAKSLTSLITLND
jgi:SPP1 gp7 family putative phage head morphogenesis protein